MTTLTNRPHRVGQANYMMRLTLTLTVLALHPAVLLPQMQGAGPADLVVTAGRIYTADAARPVVQAIAVREGRIVFGGSAAEAATLRGPATRVLDLPGRTVIPGMVDAHAHLLSLGESLRSVDLTGTRSYDEIIARAAEHARTARPGEWIRGRGWNQMEWADTRFPSHEALSRAVPDHPVVLERVDGHAYLVNARAMQAAQVTAATRDPAGGRIVRDARGAPTGVLVDNAMDLIDRVIPLPSREELRARTLAAIADANRWGLTGIHDAGVRQHEIEVYEELAHDGGYNLRTYVMVWQDSLSLARAFARGPQSALHDGRLWLRAIKIQADGALGSRGAALLEDYSDEPGNRGLDLVQTSFITGIAERALRSGFQVSVHAIGDRANRTVLDAYAQALRQFPTADHRFRIEHAQVVHRQDIPRFAELGIIPSMQGSHQTSDAAMAMNRIGYTRSLGAYAWRQFLNSGVIVPNGSDSPVEAVNPLISFHSAVTRQDANNWPAGGWLPEERMTREEALYSMTLWPAWAAFMERDAGSLTPGKYADFVILDQDIMTCAPERILDTQVVMTVLGGRVVYERRSQ